MRHSRGVMLANMNNPPIMEEVRHITRETSEKYIVQPSKRQVLADLLIGLKRFRNAVRWKEFFFLEKLKKLKEKNLSPTSTINNFDFNEDEEKIEEEGLGTNLKSNYVKSAPKGSDKTEAFLRDIERTLLQELETNKPPPLTKKGKEIRHMEKNLQADPEYVVSRPIRRTPFR